MENTPLNRRIRAVRSGIRAQQPIGFRIEAVRRKASQRKDSIGLRSQERQFEER
ncbi:MAG: hypothetical protein AAGF67_11425 [Verrucomicrobiota bacterium]